MGNVYSVLIFEGHNLSSTVDITLDPSFVWIVRDIDVFFPGPDASPYLGVVAASVGATFFEAIPGGPVLAGGQWVPWRGRQVFVPDGGVTLTIVWSSTFTGPDVRISGYKLTP